MNEYWSITPRTEAEHCLHDLLQNQLELKRRHLKPLSENFFDQVDLVLQYGLYFTPVPMTLKPKPVSRPQYCFENAYTAARNSDQTVLYVEGYALGVIDVYHAWDIDADTGRLQDVTWTGQGGRPTRGQAYLGVPFKFKAAREMICAYQRYGLLDNYLEHWPLLSQPLEKWYAPQFLEQAKRPRS